MSNIKIENKESIRILTINRPDKLNALNRETIKELGEAVQDADNTTSVRAVIITGEGQKAFVAGADISEFYQYNQSEAENLSKVGHDSLFNLIENTEVPVIAAVNGFALGGGLELAMACHIRLASSNARMGLPEVSLGVIPGYGGTQRLAQLIGKGRAIEMIASAGMITAEDAYRVGLINHITDQEQLMDRAIEIANSIIKNSKSAIAAAIRCVNASYDKEVNGYQKEIEEFGNCFTTEDFKEGTSAFMEKRKPNFN